MSRARELADLGNNAGGLETLTVSDITDITATADEINLVDGSVTGPLSHRNIIINGGMTINQRSISSLAQTSSAQYTVDRFTTVVGSSFNLDTTINQIDLTGSDFATTGQSKALKIEADTTQTPSGSHNGGIGTFLEGQDVQRLLYGTSSAKDSVLSFWAKGSTNSVGTYTCQIDYVDSSSNHYSQYHTFSLTTSWTEYTINIGGNGTATSSAPPNTNAVGFRVTWWLASGPDDLVSATSTWVSNPSPTYHGVTGMSNFMDDDSNEFYLTGVQLELGSVATPFEHRSYGDELARCQRYYCRGRGSSNDIEDASAPTVDFPVAMRASPSVVNISDYSGNADKMSRYAGNQCNVSSATANTGGIYLIQHDAESANRVWFLQYVADADFY